MIIDSGMDRKGPPYPVERTRRCDTPGCGYTRRGLPGDFSADGWDICRYGEPAAGDVCPRCVNRQRPAEPPPDMATASTAPRSPRAKGA